MTDKLYVENRVFCLFRTFVFTDSFKSAEYPVKLNNSFLKNYDEHTLSMIEFDLLSKHHVDLRECLIDNHIEWSVHSMKAYLNDQGFLIIQTKLNIPEQQKNSDIEKLGLKMNSYIKRVADSLIKEILNDFTSNLHPLKGLYNFGVSNTFLFDQHVFEISQIDISDPFQSEKYSGKGEWSFFIWSLRKDSTHAINEILNINSLALFNSVLLEYGTELNLKTIGSILSGKKTDSDKLREFYSFVDYIHFNIKIIKKELLDHQILLLRFFREKINLEEKESIFNKSRSSLKYSIESIEAKEQKKGAKIVQIMLSFFTGITIYSVINDLVNFFKMDINFSFSFLSLNSIIVLSATIFMVIVFIVLYRKS